MTCECEGSCIKNSVIREIRDILNYQLSRASVSPDSEVGKAMKADAEQRIQEVKNRYSNCKGLTNQ